MYILGIHTKAGELDEIPLGFATSDDAIAYLDDRFEEVAYGGRVNMDGTKFTLLFAWPSGSDEWVEVRIIHINDNSRIAMHSDDEETRVLGRIANHIINEHPQHLYYYYMGKSSKIIAMEEEQRRVG